ncbi:Asp-tRNA(Asn)/Glu-tRNA(Gln) amidotransferase subunit GatC [Treponema pedis]|uniref:Glutamyl-tRNA(Gln) amidotransferase subunit C n=1 Tax=Treponema pedis TaxID=409322 RepID=A0A7S6WQ20_9SPIR|nr:aspartyl/glutamyl-tRNA amidotransferase subunit C [Treponema pedis]QOW61238.1 Asp-tRNA(Asn)/Glu-tRNA(Gln) amidotransferase GatCAB subunit C [Treponema pedis]
MEKNDNKISNEVFSSLLYLSRLSAGKEESEVLSQQINRLIGYFKILDKFADPDTGNSMYAAQDEASLRSDEIKEGARQIDLKKMTAEYMDNYFRVPKVLGSGA